MGRTKREVIKMLLDFKEKAKEKHGIQRIILFGSQTRGSTRVGSDIDLLIVSNKFKNRADFMSKLLEEWHIVQKKKAPVDFVCFSEQEFNRMSKKITIVKQALEEGMEI